MLCFARFVVIRAGFFVVRSNFWQPRVAWLYTH
nr:MAG TPA: hypothetical protein [Microviridae sp.]